MIARLKRKYKDLISDKKFSEILTGSAFSLVARVFVTLLTLISSVIIARFYGAEAMGIMAVIQSFLMLATIFTVLGTNTSVLRLIPEHIAKYSFSSAFRVYRRTQFLVAMVSLLTGGILFLGSGFVAERVFSKPHLGPFFATAAAFILFKSLMDLNTQAVRGVRLIRTYAVMQVLPAGAMLALLALATPFSRAEGIPLYALLGSWAFTAVVGALIMDRAFRQRMRPQDKCALMGYRETLSLSLPMLMTASIQFFIGQMGVILLAKFRSEAEVGHYSIAVKLATMTAFVLQAINSMAAPKFSELYHKGKLDELFYVAKKSAKFIFWTTTPILFVLLVFGKTILLYVFGKPFVSAYPAMVFLVIGQFFNSISGSTGYFMNMTGNEKVFTKIIFIAAVINVSLCLFLIPGLGTKGAAIAGMTSSIFWNAVTLVYIYKKYGQVLGYFPAVKVAGISAGKL